MIQNWNIPTHRDSDTAEQLKLNCEVSTEAEKINKDSKLHLDTGN